MSGSNNDIIHLNVGGTRFSTSRQTLECVPDTFFTALLSGHVPSSKDNTGAIFIDRDPKYFLIILNFLRTRQLFVKDIDLHMLRHEADYYGIAPLISRLILCEEMTQSSCGNILFYGYLSPPNLPIQGTPAIATAVTTTVASSTTSNYSTSDGLAVHNSNVQNHTRPGSIVRIPNGSQGSTISNSAVAPAASTHSCASNGDVVPVMSNHALTMPKRELFAGSMRVNMSSRSSSDLRGCTSRAINSHSRTASLDLRHVRNSSADLNKLIRNDIGVVFNPHVSNWTDPLRVQIIKAHHNWIAVAYAHFVVCYRLKDSSGWKQVFTSPYIEECIERVALNSKLFVNLNSSNARVSSSNAGAANSRANSANTRTSSSNNVDQSNKMIAVSYGSQIRLWGISHTGDCSDIGIFNLNVRVEYLFFIGSQLVALSSTGKIGVWHYMSQHWQTQEVVPICSFDTAGSFLWLGCNNGCIYSTDMQKFPLRMKDNDLLVNKLYQDFSLDPITAISVYLTPKTSVSGNWIEIAYGTKSGVVRVIAQHPETIVHSPQLFQTFSVHQSPVTKVTLSKEYLVSVCSEYNHVRTWKVTRFRDIISTQPGLTPDASFKLVALDAVEPHIAHSAGNDFGPFGDQEDQLFVQKVTPDTDQLFVRYASNGNRICTIKSIDGTTISSFCVHECDGSTRMGSRARRFIFTGHSNGAVQMWDLTYALELASKKEPVNPTSGGPTPEELLLLLDPCDLSNSYTSTPCASPCSQLTMTGNAHLPASRIKSSNLAFLNQ